MRLTGAIGSLSLLILASAGCGQDSGSPEQQVRDLLERAEEAAEAREVGFFSDFIAEDYSDDMGRDRAALIALTRLYFLQHQSIHVLSRIESIDFPVEELARVALVAGLAGRDEQADSQWDLRADVYRFALDLRRGADGWKLTRAEWRRGAARRP